MRERVKIYLDNFEKALKNLKNAVENAKDDLDIDGTIKRFELCYELFWKLLKSYLEDQGIVCKTPRECFKQSILVGIIEDENVAISMIEDRNLLVHTYDFENSREIFERIKSDYLVFFESAMRLIKGDKYE